MNDMNHSREILLDHYRKPRNKGRLEFADATARGSNPRCGDDIEVTLRLNQGVLTQVAFQGRGCSVCIASASLMTEVVSGKERQHVLDLTAKMNAWFSTADSLAVEPPAPSLQALSAVRQHPARKRCVLLAWQALEEALG